MNKLFLMIGFFPLSALAADYSHCVDFVNKRYATEFSVRSLFKLDAEGKIDTSSVDGNAVFAQNGDLYVFKQKTWLDANASNVTSVKTKEGRPIEISRQYMEKNTPVGEPKVIAFNEKNGICYAEKLSGTMRENFNINLCRDLADYLASTPEAKKCGQCGNEQTNKRLLGIMGKYEDITQSSKLKEAAPKAEDPVWNQVIKMTNQPLSRAMKVLDECNRASGIGSALADKRIWAKAAGNSAPKEAPKGGSLPAN